MVPLLHISPASILSATYFELPTMVWRRRGVQTHVLLRNTNWTKFTLKTIYLLPQRESRKHYIKWGYYWQDHFLRRALHTNNVLSIWQLSSHATYRRIQATRIWARVAQPTEHSRISLRSIDNDHVIVSVAFAMTLLLLYCGTASIAIVLSLVLARVWFKWHV